MQVQLKSISHEIHNLSACIYVEELVECIIKDEHVERCLIKRYTNKYATYKNTLDNFIFMDDHGNIIGDIKCNIAQNKRSYEIITPLPYKYIGQIDIVAFLLMYIYYNSAWKGFMEINGHED